MAERTLRVLEVLDPPDGTTRYADQLVWGLPDWVHVEFFTWRRAFRGRYDILHVHWPERLTRSTGPARTLATRLALVALLLWLRVRRVAVLRTEHNVTPHEPGDRLEALLLRWLDAWTTMAITLNRHTPVRPGTPVVLIPHGDYREAFARQPRSAVVEGRLLYFGLIRPYKGVDALLEAFHGLDDADLTLRLVGRALDDGWRRTIEQACEADARVSARLEFVPDLALVEEVTAAEVVVLPFHRMHNSGSVLVALSLGRPVVVPRGPVASDLAAEVGPGWVHLYDGTLTTELLAEALTSLRSAERTEEPVMVGRGWDAIGQAHAAAFAQAAALAGRRGAGGSIGGSGTPETRTVADEVRPPEEG